MNPTNFNRYESLKEQYSDALFLFRVGDFYECYEQDAVAAADILGITLTNWFNKQYAAFPFHALDTYLPKLVRNGYRIGIVEDKSGCRN